MAFKVTDIEKDLPKLNIELTRMDQHDQQLSDLRAQVGQLKKLVQAGPVLDATKVAPENHLSQNNMIFTWTGATHTLSWAPGYDHTSGHYIPIAAGSRVLLASTFYWTAWSPSQQIMSIDPNLQLLHDIESLLIICQIFTGTAGQTGAVGGGGTEPGGIGICGKQYKLF